MTPSNPTTDERAGGERFFINLDENVLSVIYRNNNTDASVAHTATVDIQDAAAGSQLMNITQTVN